MVGEGCLGLDPGSVVAGRGRHLGGDVAAGADGLDEPRGDLFGQQPERPAVVFHFLVQQ